jgi:signal transduction histidine kinase
VDTKDDVTVRHRDGLSPMLHDLRQYIAAGLLIYDDGDEDGDRLGEEALRTRLAMGHRLFRQLSQVVDRQDPDRPGQPATVDLRELIGECVDIFRHRHPSIHVHSDLRGPLVCLIDREGLHRALTNVLDNGARAAGPDGHINVKARQRDGQIVVEIADDGLGFGHITHGRGHGMVTVDEVMRAARGRLEIRSGPDSGTRVRLRFPCFLNAREA